jgi:hypothetical protein
VRSNRPLYFAMAWPKANPPQPPEKVLADCLLAHGRTHSLVLDRILGEIHEAGGTKGDYHIEIRDAANGWSVGHPR